MDFSTWSLIEPRLIQLNFTLLEKLRAWDDVFRLKPDEFEQLVGEVLDKNGFSVLWVPGGKDGGIDIVASSSDCDYLIDVKRWHAKRPVTIELVRQVYGVAEAVAKSKDNRGSIGGIITSSRFTQDAEDWQKTLRPRPLLRDGDWLKQELRKYAPRMRTSLSIL